MESRSRAFLAMLGLGWIAVAAAAEPAAAESAAGSSPWWVQVGAQRDRGEAEAMWKGLRARLPELLGGAPHAVARADLGPRKGVYFRLRVGPHRDRAAAARMCVALRAKKVDCFLVRARPEPATAVEAGAGAAKSSAAMGKGAGTPKAAAPKAAAPKAAAPKAAAKGPVPVAKGGEQAKGAGSRNGEGRTPAAAGKDAAPAGEEGSREAAADGEAQDADAPPLRPSLGLPGVTE